MVIDFFNLACEIRNKVYEDLLFTSDRITIELGGKSSSNPYMVARLYLTP